ncbi:MAG: methylmalonyl Co-A mutase-associated GTPase MeaB [Anaerolineae bacterium]|nr:methylmalonyl Co-A mutase-associated GTPase MeaB [Anaerolineae bacterium]
MDTLARGVLSGDGRSVARAITLIESGAPQARALLDALHPHTGRAHVVGVSGAPGTGKSTLIARLARAFRQRGERVGIIGVDPTSPLSGGALLGDRIRMRDLVGDAGVYIRSMATRGAAGGLAQATSGAVAVLDAAGYDVIVVETVGAGQDEVAIAQVADTTVVLEAPGLGDEIQAIKAGLIEVADVLVVNKADRQGADQAVRALQMAVALGERAWRPPICETIALDGTGIDDVIAAIDAHRRFLGQAPDEERARARARARLEDLLAQTLLERFLADLPSGAIDGVVARLSSRELSLYEALEELGLQPTAH